MTIGDAFGRANNFDILRAFAAVLVITNHILGVRDPIFRWLDSESGGSLGVAIFFVISGFLVTKSAQSHTPATYYASRALRILPALAVCVMFCAFIIGPMFSSLSIGVYFSDVATYRYLKNILIYPLQWTLPGVFAGHQTPTVNGPLWTLPIEVSFYIFLPFLVAFGMMRRRVVLVLLAAAVLALVTIHVLGFRPFTKEGGSILMSVPMYSGLKNLCFFLAGAAMWVHRDDVRLDKGLAFGAVVACVIASRNALFPFVYMLAVPYIVIFFAIGLPQIFNLHDKVGDLSYGLYIFGFPIQQAVLAVLGVSTDRLLVLPVTIGTTAVLAYCSWWLIERPALNLRKRFRQPEIGGRSKPISAATIARDATSLASPVAAASILSRASRTS